MRKWWLGKCTPERSHIKNKGRVVETAGQAEGRASTLLLVEAPEQGWGFGDSLIVRLERVRLQTSVCAELRSENFTPSDSMAHTW